MTHSFSLRILFIPCVLSVLVIGGVARTITTSGTISHTVRPGFADVASTIAPLAHPAAERLEALLGQAPGLNPLALQTALSALDRLKASGDRVRSDVLGVIDYSQPSTTRRFWVFDLQHGRLLFHELVAHGKNSGGNLATRFSNAPGSLMSSLGLFLTADPYIGAHGLSLRLKGLESGVNDNMMERAIVIHAAGYVNPDLARRMGRLGRSWGCPAVRPEISRQLIRTLEGGALVLAYYPSQA